MPSTPSPINQAAKTEKSYKNNSDGYSSDRWYVGINGYEDARRLSEKYNAPILIYFQADWCHYCRELEHNLLSLSAAKNIIRPFVKVRISPEKGGAEKSLFDIMGGTGYPTLMFKSNTRALPRKVHTRNKINDEWKLLTPYEFKERIDQIIADAGTQNNIFQTSNQ